MLLTKFEDELWGRGVVNIAGVDEVGRGPLAGPLVVCAVILDKSNVLKKPEYAEINDSKKLTPSKRQKLSEFLLSEPIHYAIAAIPATQIDTLGMAASLQSAFTEAVTKLKIEAQHILTDHLKIQNVSAPQTNITKGDSLSVSIAAASIIAKVYRDNLMDEYAQKWPIYGFGEHKGYGTKQHLEALAAYGPCEIHRMSFKPLTMILK